MYKMTSQHLLRLLKLYGCHRYVLLGNILWISSSSVLFAHHPERLKSNRDLPVHFTEVIQRNVKGKVTDGSGLPLNGVTVSVEGSNLTVSTNEEGEFVLANVPANAILIFTSVSYTTKRVSVDNRDFIAVTLDTSSSNLDEVVVVGYGTQKKGNLTASVTQISGKKIEDRMSPNVVSSLQGLVPNLGLSYGNNGGEPGSTPSFNLRGPGSLSGGSPFVLVDGVPQDMNNINSNDIESITVLKDASASAIYGARAAYGVILITTKKGQIGAKPNINASVNTALQKPTLLPKIVSSFEFATMVNDAFVNAGQQKRYPDEVMAMIMEEIKTPGSLPRTIPNSSNPNEWDTNLNHANTNAYDAFYKDFGLNQNYDLSLSGGGNAISYYVSGGLYNQGAQFRYGDENFKRYTLTANLESNVTKWLKLGINSKYIKGKIQMPHVYAGTGDFYHDIPRRWPIWPIYDENGHFAINTMALMADGGRLNSDRNQMVNSFLFQITLNPYWKINADFNITQDFNTNSDHAKTIYMYKVDNTPSPEGFSRPNGYSLSKSSQLYNSNNIFTSYERSFRSHYFKAMVGGQYDLNQSESLTVSRGELITDNVPFITTATGDPTVGASKSHWGTTGIFGRINYNFDEKYLIEVSSRYDGTSRFGEGRRWGLFPSVSVGYNVAKESFWAGLVDNVSMLKIRASYGTLGNQNVAGLYPYIANMGMGTNLDWMMGNERPLYTTAPGLVSPDLTWETATTLNFGLDVNALQDRLSMTLDLFRRNTTNMFGPSESYPSVLGVSPPSRNNASMQTKGFELSLGWRDRIGEIGYAITGYLADNVSTVTQYQNKTGTLTTYYEGQTLGEIWGYRIHGLFQTDEEIVNGPDQSFIGTKWTPGDVHYKDLNDDGKINYGQQTLEDHGDFEVIGNNMPRYSYGLDIGLNWKGLDLSMLWQGVGERQVWLGGNFLFGDFGNYNQITIFDEHLDYWRPDNTDAFFPKPYMTELKFKNVQLGDRWLQSAAYLRLKNLQMGYTFNSNWLQKLAFNSVRVYLTGENLLTFTDMIKTFDPEILAGSYGSGKSYPLATTYSLGIKLNLK